MEDGTKLIALWDEKYVDHVTEGKEYKVTKINDIGFWIINDEGKEVFPVSSRFKKIKYE
jgi:hypothetical protein